jgi:predicted nuclease of predicted toxin-antitoxin system
MQILIDECLDWRLKREFPGHTAMTVTDMGWGGIKNGALLALAQGRFEVFLTADKNLAKQLNLPNYSIAVIVLDTLSTRLADCTAMMPKVLALLPQVTPGTVSIVSP